MAKDPAVGPVSNAEGKGFKANLPEDTGLNIPHDVKEEVEAKIEEEATPEVPDTYEAKLESMTVPELKDIASDLGITGYSKMKKDELVELLAETLMPTPEYSSPGDPDFQYDPNVPKSARLQRIQAANR